MTRRQKLAYNLHRLITLTDPQHRDIGMIAFNCEIREHHIRGYLKMEFDCNDRVIASMARYFGVTPEEMLADPVIDAGWKQLSPEV
ncbi:MAG: hypothetical protein QM811_16540 [Pirellulales bacterium]